MTEAIIYKPSKSANQSGLKTKPWVLEFTGKNTSQEPTTQQLHLCFDSLEDATAYAHLHKIKFEVLTHNQKKIKPNSYSDNFR